MIETQANTKQQNDAKINHQHQRDTNTKEEKRESGPIKAERKCKQECAKYRNSRKKTEMVSQRTNRTNREEQVG